MDYYSTYLQKKNELIDSLNTEVKEKLVHGQNKEQKFLYVYNHITNNLNKQLTSYSSKLQNSFPGLVECFENGQKIYGSEWEKNVLENDCNDILKQIAKSKNSNLVDGVVLLANWHAQKYLIWNIEAQYRILEYSFALNQLNKIDLSKEYDTKLEEKLRLKLFGPDKTEIPFKIEEDDKSQIITKKKSKAHSNLNDDIFDDTEKGLLLHYLYHSIHQRQPQEITLPEFLRIISICNNIYHKSLFQGNPSEYTMYHRVNRGTKYFKSIQSKDEKIDVLLSKLSKSQFPNLVHFLNSIKKYKILKPKL